MGTDNCRWGCRQRSKILRGVSVVNSATEAIRRALRPGEPSDRPKTRFQMYGRIMLGDRETWQAELPENVPVPQDDTIDVESSLLQPVIDDIVDLITKDEQGENTDFSKVRQVSSSLSILAEAFERIATSGGAITDGDREAISQGLGGILQLAFYSDLRQSE